jgi:hypothetical protein
LQFSAESISIREIRGEIFSAARKAAFSLSRDCDGLLMIGRQEADTLIMKKEKKK